MMTPDQMQALGFEIKRDGPAALVILKNGAIAGHIVRSNRDRTLWRAATMRGDLRHVRSISAGVYHIVSLMS